MLNFVSDFIQSRKKLTNMCRHLSDMDIPFKFYIFNEKSSNYSQPSHDNMYAALDCILSRNNPAYIPRHLKSRQICAIEFIHSRKYSGTSHTGQPVCATLKSRFGCYSQLTNKTGQVYCNIKAVEVIRGQVKNRKETICCFI